MARKTYLPRWGKSHQILGMDPTEFERNFLHPGLTSKARRSLDEIRADEVHIRPMTSRQTFDRAVLRTTGADIRLEGNWQPLDSLNLRTEDLADELRIDPAAVRRCRDISDILALIDGAGGEKADSDDTPSLFSSR